MILSITERKSFFHYVKGFFMSTNFASPASSVFFQKLPDTSFSAIKRRGIFAKAIQAISNAVAKKNNGRSGGIPLRPNWRW